MASKKKLCYVPDVAAAFDLQPFQVRQLVTKGELQAEQDDKGRLVFLMADVTQLWTERQEQASNGSTKQRKTRDGRRVHKMRANAEDIAFIREHLPEVGDTIEVLSKYDPVKAKEYRLKREAAKRELKGEMFTKMGVTA